MRVPRTKYKYYGSILYSICREYSQVASHRLIFSTSCTLREVVSVVGTHRLGSGVLGWQSGEEGYGRRWENNRPL